MRKTFRDTRSSVSPAWERPLAVRTKLGAICETFEELQAEPRFFCSSDTNCHVSSFAGTIVGVGPCGLCSNFDLRDRQICIVPHCNAPLVNERGAPHGLSLGISTSLRPPPLENLPPRESVSRRRVENSRSLARNPNF